MSRFQNRIITASAGTGKTYRLALEYVRIVLHHHNVEGFSLDNILVLTFTRKATAEIRERIVEHLELLCNHSPEKEKDRRNLIRNLGFSLAEDGFGEAQESVIRKTLAILAADRKLLQVMTIDAYINAIFRNIVRPLRSIDSFEIDLMAVQKRMPFLLEHLMTPRLRSKLDGLLRRKVNSSLDSYSCFFASMIDCRWLHYMIHKRLAPATDQDFQFHRQYLSELKIQAEFTGFQTAFGKMLELLAQVLADKDVDEMFNSAFKDLFTQLPATLSGVQAHIESLCQSPQGCYRVFQAVANINLYNANKLRGRDKLQALGSLQTWQEELRRHLANYLMFTLFLPEQEEIITLWEELLQEYDRLIYRYKNMTYNDISWFSLEALFSDTPPQFDLQTEVIANEFYQFLSHRSRFILIDEFQDTSLLQMNILSPIIDEVISGEGSKDFGGLVVVGDEKQSIFGWRGGERDLLLNLRQLFPQLVLPPPDPDQDVLTTSWRSSPSLIRFINGVFGNKALHGYLNDQQLVWNYPESFSGKEDLEPLSHIGFSLRAYQSRNPGQNLETVFRDFVVNTIQPWYDEESNQTYAILCRKSSELNELQGVLDEFGITSIFQPAGILQDHTWVSPLITWLRFLAFKDWLDFLAVLRSNYLMLKAAPLKDVIAAISSALEQGREPDFSSCPLASELYLLSRQPVESLYHSCTDLLDLCLGDKSPHERDYLNIHSFLSLMQDFELNRAQRDKSIPAFLDYLEENRYQEAFKQVAIEGGNTMQLLTIHKAKGLEFDRVFVFYNLSGGKGSDHGNLSWFVDYAGKDFRYLQDFALTYHYKDLLPHSDYHHLAELADQRELLEEMNILYVAFTRAKTALHICFAYQGNKGWETYYKEQLERRAKLPVLVCQAALDYFEEKGIPADESGNYVIRGTGSYEEPEQKEPQRRLLNLDTQALAKLLPPKEKDGLAGLKPREYDTGLDLKKLWLQDRQNLIGDLAHHYLSYLKVNLPQEHNHASQQCLARFCGIFTQSEILDLIQRLNSALAQHPELFDPRYDKVYTELTLFHQGRELRLDRLMLDTRAKTALIVDYKTGGIKDEGQLELYRQALAEQPVIAQNNYRIDTRYILLQL